MENQNHYTTGQLMRLKSNVPFSQSLNDYINQQYAILSDVLHIGFVNDPEPYKDAKAMFADIKSGYLKISKAFSENTIFGDPEANWKFRAVHDYQHFVHKLSFSVQDEMILNYKHMQECQAHGLSSFDLTLLQIEMAGQVAFYHETGNFPENQRHFTIQELSKYGY